MAHLHLEGHVTGKALVDPQEITGDHHRALPQICLQIDPEQQGCAKGEDGDDHKKRIPCPVRRRAQFNHKASEAGTGQQKTQTDGSVAMSAEGSNQIGTMRHRQSSLTLVTKPSQAYPVSLRGFATDDTGRRALGQSTPGTYQSPA
jgi:hypothetical protein